MSKLNNDSKSFDRYPYMTKPDIPQNKSPVDPDTIDALIFRKLGERISNLEKENETLRNALFKACGDDKEVVQVFINFQRN